MNHKFEKAYETIKAPDALKAEILDKMLTEDMKLQQNGMETEEIPFAEKHRTAKMRLYRYFAPAIVACAAVVCLVLFWPRGIRYITPLEEGVYYDEIELKNGVIKFNQKRVAISITPNAGKVVIGAGTSEEDASDSRVITEEQTQSGGELVCRETAQLSLPEIREDAWSNIGQQKIYVTVLKTDAYRYQAAFEKDGAAYEVIGSNVTQKEFIEFLHAQIK